MPVDPARAKSLFLAASELADPAKRAAYLDRECGGDAELRERVEALLRANDSAPLPPVVAATMDSVPGQPQTEDREDRAAQVGVVIAGKYTLAEVIGEGGMGSVWRAKQTEPVKRFVAVKLIKAGMDSRQVLARFDAERQALALMDHPNIAKVLDGGLHERRPYFVMELVKGVPITEYCDSQKLTPQQRLELFVPVCQAIQHAHQKGIIHRDIKPSNVLVALYDDKPVVKVIDFGVAKATGGALTEATIDTGFGSVVGTPEYMSPEQATFNNLDIDTRSDVYALGVLLYELLTGTPPFSKHELEKKGLLEMLRVVREEEPPRPSTKLSTADALPTLSANRGTEPKKLTGLLRNELDWIVMKALEKDRARRYETANGLAADVQRYLADEVVEARPPSTGYRLKKFIHRNRAMVSTVSAVVAALVIGILGFAWQAQVASHQRDLAEQARESEAQQRKIASDERDRALRAQEKEAEQRKLAEAARVEAESQKTKALAQEAEAKKQANIAKAVAKFQTDMLAAVNPNQLPKDPVTKEPLKDKVTVVQAMEAAVRKLDAGSLQDQPLVEADVRNTIGMSFFGLGRFAEAEPVFRKALAIKRESLPAGDVQIAGGLSNLATVLMNQGKLAEAEKLYREALSIFRGALPAGNWDLAKSLSNLATLLRLQEKLAEAEPLFREALSIYRAAGPAEHKNTALVLNNLAQVLQAQNKLAEAETLFREAVSINRANLPAGHPNIGLCLNNLALLLHEQRRLTEAESLYREALKIDRAALPAGHTAIARELHNLADLLQEQNKLAEAEPLAREALEMLRAALPAGHPDIAHGLNNVARILRAQNKLAEAEPFAREALSMLRATFPAGHPDIAYGLNSLALLLQVQDKLSEAEPLFREALEIRRKARPAGHPEIAFSLYNLAALLQVQNKFDEAEPLHHEALEIRRKALPAGHADIAASLYDLATILQARNKLAEAIPLLEEAYRASKREGSLAWVGTGLLEAYARAADVTKPETMAKVTALREELVADARSKMPKESPELAGQLAPVGLTLLTLKFWDEAEPLLRECLAIREKAEPDAWSTFNTQSMLGGALLGQKKYADAEPLLLKGYEGMKAREKTIPKGAETRIPDALDRLIELYTATNKADEVNKYQAERAKYPQTNTPEENK